MEPEEWRDETHLKYQNSVALAVRRLTKAGLEGRAVRTIMEPREGGAKAEPAGRRAEIGSATGSQKIQGRCMEQRSIKRDLVASLW